MRLEELGHGHLHYINETLTRISYQRVLSPGDHVLDLGANEGGHTREMARLVGSTGLVHAFEPNPVHFKSLTGIENVRLWPFAAGESLNVLSLQVPESLDGWASLKDLTALLPDRAMVLRDAVAVPVDALTEIRGRPVKFVKVDVEGWEYFALKGMMQLITSSQPVIVIENVTAEIAELLGDAGYSIRQFDGQPWHKPGYPLVNCMAVPGSRRNDVITTATDVQAAVDESLRVLGPK